MKSGTKPATLLKKDLIVNLYTIEIYKKLKQNLKKENSTQIS